MNSAAWNSFTVTVVVAVTLGSLREDAVIIAMANPTPEIMPDEAKKAGAYVVGTGRSDFPNQINNVLVFPGLFRGALDARAKTVNREMLLAAARGLQSCVSDSELSREYILPYAWDRKAHEAVAEAVKRAAIDTGVSKIYNK